MPFDIALATLSYPHISLQATQSLVTVEMPSGCVSHNKLTSVHSMSLDWMLVHSRAPDRRYRNSMCTEL